MKSPTIAITFAAVLCCGALFVGRLGGQNPDEASGTGTPSGTGLESAEDEDFESPGGPSKQPETLLELAVSGGWMMVPLCLLSVVVLTVFIERLVVLRRKNVVPRQLASVLGLDETLPDLGSMTELLRAHPSSASRVLGAAVQALKTSPEKVEKAVNDAAQLEMYSLKKNLWIFAVIASMAPLIGLLGTVIGLVQAFREVALSGLGSGARLAPGIYEALVCTVGGLSVAIPAMAIYYSVGARIDHYVFELDRLAVGLVQGYPSRERPHPPPLVAPKGR